MKSLYRRCKMWFNCVERKRYAKLPASATAPRGFAAAPLFQACLRAFICTFCLCVCIYVYECMCADMYICIYMHVCMYLYIYGFIHMCICMCMHIRPSKDCGSQYQCFSVWTVSCMRTCVRVNMYAYAYVCRYICVCIFVAMSVACTLQVFWALVHGQACTLHGCVFTPTYTSANTLAAGCAHMCICIYVCLCMHMHTDAYVRL